MNDYLTKTAWIFALAVVVSFWMTVEDCRAQTKVEVDENVKVHFLGSWHDGYVVDTERKQILVEFEWAGSPKREVVTRSQVRRLYEVNAIDYGRNWESANGKFKIDAALKNLVDGEVVLIKLDLDEIKVPLERLSAKDIAYVKRLKKKNDAAIARGEIPAITPDLPELKTFTGGMVGMSTFNGENSSERTPLGLIPDYLTQFEHAGFGFKMARKGQRLVAVIPVGGPEKLVLLSAREENSSRGPHFQAQLYWVSLKKTGARVVSTIPLTPEDFALDYDPKQQLLLTFHRQRSSQQSGEPDYYTLWKLKPGDSTAEPMVRWAGNGMSWANNLFAKIINERIVVAKTAKQTYVAWDIVDEKMLYEITSNSFFDAPVVLSPNRGHLIFAEDGQVSIINAITGELEMLFKVDDRHVSGANINPSGTKLAALTERNIYVWELDSSELNPLVYPAPLMGSPFSSRVEWIDDDHILGQSSRQRILYRLSLKLPIWSYEMDIRDYFLNRDPLKNMVVNGMFFYVSKPDVFGSGIAVGSVELPGPDVAEVTQNIDRDSLMILKPGVRVGLSIGSVSDVAKVRKWLSEKVEKNHWVLDDNAEIQIHADMGVGETQTVEYRPFGAGFGRGESKTVSFRPHYASLKIMNGETIIWQTGTSTGPPPMISSNNIQAELNRFQKPQITFFQGVKIDKKIIDPKFSRGFGVSKLGLRGIQVVSTSPPGREDDPLAASRQADEDQKKAYEESQKSSGEAGGSAVTDLN